MKTIFIILMSIIIILPIAYYLVSPAFIVNEIEEKSPLEALEIKDSMNTMDAATKAEFEKQVGEIKGTKGSFNYNLDSSIDTEKYNKVLVWCVPFGVLFSFADIA